MADVAGSTCQRTGDQTMSTGNRICPTVCAIFEQTDVSNSESMLFSPKITMNLGWLLAFICAFIQAVNCESK